MTVIDPLERRLSTSKEGVTLFLLFSNFFNVFFKYELNQYSISFVYDVRLLNNESAHDKKFYFKYYSTIEFSPSIYSAPLSHTHTSLFDFSIGESDIGSLLW